MMAVLENINLRSAHLLVMNSQTQTIRFHIAAGEQVSAKFSAMYVNKYVRSNDNIMAVIKSKPIGEFYGTNMLPNAKDMHKSDYHRR